VTESRWVLRYTLLLIGLVGCGRFEFDPVPPDALTGIPLPACENVQQDPGEDGIDCGGACPLKCANASCSSGTECITGNCVNTFCDLASGPPSWLPGPPLITPRDRVQAATDGEGTIHVISGAPITGAMPGVVATTESLREGATAWEIGPPLSEARHSYGVASFEGNLYVYGGNAGNDQNRMSTEMLVGGIGGSWQPRQPFSGNAGIAFVPARDRRIYVLDFTAFAYDVDANSWQTIAALTTVRRDVAGGALGIDGLVYEIGGQEMTTNARCVEVDALDPATQQWVSRMPMPMTRGNHASVPAPDGRIYVVGGDFMNGNQALEVIAYDPITNHWAVVAPITTKRLRNAAAVGGDGRIFTMGGHVGTVVTGTVEVYGPVLVLSSSTVRVDDSVAVSATNFAGNATLVARIDGIAVATGITNGAGSATLQLTVPSLMPGTHDLVVVDQRSQYPVRARIAVE